MSYVDALYDKDRDVVRVAERVNSKRILVDYKPEYTFYVQDPGGKKRSIFGDAVAEIKCQSAKSFHQHIKQYRGCKTFETDIKPLNKTLEKYYTNQEPPVLHTAFFDIEVDFDPHRGYASTEEAFMPITAIGVYLQWVKTMVCLSVPPPTITKEQAINIAASIGPEVIICDTEEEMLDMFLTLIDDADILSGWNSEGYDIPYTVNRIIQVMGKQSTRRLCLWDKMPKLRKYESHGKEAHTYDLMGRVHLDYLQLYRKYNYEERHSYRLDYIGEMEVNENKVAYEGSLDRLYKYDYEKFLRYNIQDVMLLDKLDEKLQYIELANTIAHDNTVLLPTVMGAVATTEQAIINEAHRRGLVVPDRNFSPSDSAAAGAYVAVPKKGMHHWIGSIDLNSLYPSVFRVLNMAPETLVGQVRTTYTDAEIKAKMEGKWVDPDTGAICKKMSAADAWHGKFSTNEYEYIMAKNTEVPLELDMVDGSSYTLTGSEIYNLVFNGGQPWCISANGTIFKTDVQGVIPGLLERWYSGRKVQQKTKKMYSALNDGIELPSRLQN